MTSSTTKQIGAIARQTTIEHSIHIWKAWCESCLDVAHCLTLESAADVLRIPFRTLFALLKSGKLHLVEVGSRLPLICCNSISTKPTETEK